MITFYTRIIGYAPVALVLMLSAAGGLVSSQACADPPKIAGFAAPGTAGEVYWQQYKDAVRTLSGGRLDVTLMVLGEAGPEETQFAGLRRNRLQVGGISTGTLGLAVPELAVLRAPFLFDSLEEASFVLDRYLLEFLVAKFRDKDLVLLSWMMDGWMDIYATFPIHMPEDVARRKLRISADDSALMFFRSLKADVIQIPLSDVIPSMQTGLVEGGEQSTQIFALAGLESRSPYLSLTHHAYSTAGVVANKSWWDSLPREDQLVYRDAVPNAVWYRSFVLEKNESYLAAARSRGLTVIEPKQNERAEWQKRGLSIHRTLIEKIGGDAAALYEEVMAAKAVFAAEQNELGD
ncbi:MAG: TRAP transporter substrate-binding protein [Rhodospirillaceae bacterium]